MIPMPRIEKLRAFLFENTSLRQTVAKNTIWQGVGITTSRLVKAILVIYAARLLGTHGYGIFSYALGIAGFFSVFSDIGLGGILTREASKAPSSLQTYFSTTLVLKLIFTLASFILIIGITPFITNIPEALPLIPLAALIIALDGLRDFVLTLARVKEKMQIEAALHAITNISITAFGLFAVLSQKTPAVLLLGYALGTALGTISALWYFREYLRNFWKFFERTLVLTILKEAWPFAFVGVLGIVMTNTDTIMLGWFLDAEAVGLYTAALRPVQLFYFLPVILSVSLFPPFARLAGKNPEQFRRVFEAALLLTFLLSLPLLAGGLVLSSDIIQFVFGPGYLEATPAFTVLLFTLLTNFPAALLVNAIFAHGKQERYAGALFLGAIGNALLNVVFIPLYGIVGAAIATLTAQLLAYGSMWYVLEHIAPFVLFRRLPRIVLATLGMAGAVFLMKTLGLHILATTILGAALYFILLVLFKEPVLRHLNIKKLIS